MNSIHLNEHDANQGAQSRGEFLGMTGNSGWYLLGSGGAAIMMVILLWGILGVSLLLCLFLGIVLCLLSLAYVFGLRNNRPEHYDTDFFESALVESGLLLFRFGPRGRRPVNPFSDFGAASIPEKKARASAQTSSAKQKQRPQPQTVESKSAREETTSKPKAISAAADPTVTRVAFEQLHEQLATAEDMLEDALAERGED